MIWVFELASSCYFGFWVVAYLAGEYMDRLELLFAGIPLGVIFFGWIVFLLSSLAKMGPVMGLFAIGLMVSIGFYIKHFVKPKLRKAKISLNVIQLATYLVCGGFFITHVPLDVQGLRGNEGRRVRRPPIPSQHHIVVHCWMQFCEEVTI